MSAPFGNYPNTKQVPISQFITTDIGGAFCVLYFAYQFKVPVFTEKLFLVSYYGVMYNEMIKSYKDIYKNIQILKSNFL